MTLTRIMHVEDDESIRMVAEMALVDVAGFELLSCDGGQSALEQAEAFGPELVLLDVMMPKMDGLQTLAELRKLPSLVSTPVVFMTAKIQQAEKQQYLEAGAIAVVEKPFEPMELGDTLRALYHQASQA
ncbi:response regulator [Alkalimonas mucilaginosa]|uniref:Response regulator n=1 Tax=Alkalimonas mucilaginosa TaxID=3057676 RepID=A0ABU7JD65_9GAMM|nr:response regulator [Alkalimonas sp. MEB004]MEE2023420.1 response regulator [Alkalimonas sp. MEB004]